MNASITLAGRARAACLTPPAVGGIAVIQIAITAQAATVVSVPTATSAITTTASVNKPPNNLFAFLSRHLRKAGKPVDLESFSPTELRLCRLLDENNEELDEVLVAVRRSTNKASNDTTNDAPNDTTIVDLSLHGGTRVVQRTLLLLQRAGVEIVDALTLSRETTPWPTMLHADAAELLLRAKTRRVAAWLSQLPERLAAEITAALRLIQQNQIEQVRGRIALLLDAAKWVPMLIDGPRVVLVGEPNSGKSTLANALAEQEQALVSPMAGTTRDWTEHAAAIAGIPFTIVDTAGVREATDPIERLAIERSLQQLQRADLVLHLVDGSAAAGCGSTVASCGSTASSATDDSSAFDTSSLPPNVPIVRVYTKADLMPTIEQRQSTLAPQPCTALRVSAATGAGLAELRALLLDRLSLPSNADAWPVAFFHDRQLETARLVVQYLSTACSPPAPSCNQPASSPDNAESAGHLLRQLLGKLT